MQHPPPCPPTRHDTTTNTDKCVTCSVANLQVGGGGLGSQARCNRHATLTHTKKGITATDRDASMQHLTPGQSPPRSTTKNTYKYSRCRTGDVDGGGGGLGSHLWVSVPPANKITGTKTRSNHHKHVASTQHPPPGQSPPRSTLTNTDNYATRSAGDVGAGGGGPVGIPPSQWH